MINDLDALPQPLVLVLDDYHRITAGSPVNELLERLLAFPPIPMHLVVITRRDPPLPLTNLRAKGQMTEIRMSDLRFGPGEARSLLNQKRKTAIYLPSPWICRTSGSVTIICFELCCSAS